MQSLNWRKWLKSCLWVHSIKFIWTWFIWLYVYPPLHFLYQLHHKSVPCRLYWKSNMCDWDIVNNKACTGPRTVRFWLIKFNILKGGGKKAIVPALLFVVWVKFLLSPLLSLQQYDWDSNKLLDAISRCLDDFLVLLLLLSGREKR